MQKEHGKDRRARAGRNPGTSAPTFSHRTLPRAIRLALAVGAGSTAVAASADCVFGGATITAPTVNLVSCTLTENLTIAPGEPGVAQFTNHGKLQNDATIDNHGRFQNEGRLVNVGVFTSDGTFDGDGSFDNAGTLTVNGGSVVINRSSNLQGAKDSASLVFGRWEVIGEGRSASLSIGSGDIARNAGTILLRGPDAHFDQLNNLARNEGSLTIIGRRFDAKTLANRGVLTVGNGATVTIGSSSSLVDAGPIGGPKRLREGAWNVDAGKGKASLDLGSTDISVNSAVVRLNGAEARFSQIESLARNEGSLSLENGRKLGLTQLMNVGVINVVEGASLAVGTSDNLTNNRLSGGEWYVQGDASTTSLVLGNGSDILVNDATVGLIGAQARFAQIDRLAVNNGWLGVFNRTFITSALENPGTLEVGQGGTVDIRTSNSVQRVAGHNELASGTWRVMAGDGDATLALGNGPIAVNHASVVLSGNGAHFAAFERVAENTGSISIENGRSFSFAKLDNKGTLAVSDGGSVVIDDTPNLSGAKDGRTLAEGIWSVTGNVQKAELTIGGSQEKITTLSADVHLSGRHSVFSQIDGFTRNEDTFALESRDFTLAPTVSNVGALIFSGNAKVHADALINDGAIQLLDEAELLIGKSLRGVGSLRNLGSLTVLDGADVSIDVSANVFERTGDVVLHDGRWNVVAAPDGKADLHIGTNRIAVNEAIVQLHGAGARFDQFEQGLRKNTGSILIEDRRFDVISLYSPGALIAGKGGDVRIFESANLTNTSAGLTLSAGIWTVAADNGTAKLTVGSGPIRANDADILLSGAGASFSQIDGLALNSGSLTVSDGRSYTVNKLTNTGILLVGNGGTMKTEGELANQGLVTSRGDFIVAEGGRVTGTGSLTQGAGVLRVDGSLSQDSIEITGGTLQGTGHVDGALTLTDSDLRPGNSPGTLHIDGALDMQGGQLVIEIEGVGASQFDRLVVGGNARFTGGQLVFDFRNATPGLPTAATFDFLDAQIITGLDTLALSFLGLASGVTYSIDFGNGSIAFDHLRLASAVPLPGALWMMLPALAALVGGGHRRRQRRTLCSSG